MNKRIICVLLAVMILVLSGCSNRKVGIFTEDHTNNSSVSHGTPNKNDKDKHENNSEEITSANTESEEKSENKFVKVEDAPISSVVMNSGISSYLYFRTLVNRNYTFDQIKKCSYGFNVEEFINYFDLSTNIHSMAEGIGESLFDCPWNEDTLIYRFTVRRQEAVSTLPNNLVFCIDISESMARVDVLPLFKKVFPHFVSSIDIYDTISIVTSTGTSEIVLSGCRGDWSDQILEALDSIEITGDTNTNTDIQAAYDIAKRHFIQGGNNRVIIVSDGDIPGKLSSITEKMVSEGIYTDVLGLGYSNYKNEKLEQFASKGNGRYYYIDCESEGEKVLGSELFKQYYDFGDITATVEFDSRYVEEYRLIGYARQSEASGGMTEPDETVRNGTSGYTMTVCYELKLRDTEIPKYGKIAKTVTDDGAEYPITLDMYTADPDEDMLFMSAVIKTVMILQESEYIGSLTLENVFTELQELDLEEYPERAEFASLIYKIINPDKNK